VSSTPAAGAAIPPGNTCKPPSPVGARDWTSCRCRRKGVNAYAKTGFHRRRLERFVLALGEELTDQGTSDYHVKDHYLARVFDLVELLKLAAQVAGRVA